MIPIRFGSSAPFAGLGHKRDNRKPHSWRLNGLGPQPGNAGVLCVHSVRGRPLRPRFWTIRTHRTIWPPRSTRSKTSSLVSGAATSSAWGGDARGAPAVAARRPVNAAQVQPDDERPGKARPVRASEYWHGPGSRPGHRPGFPGHRPGIPRARRAHPEREPGHTSLQIKPAGAWPRSSDAGHARHGKEARWPQSLT